MSRTAYSPRQDQIPLGILYMVGSTIVFAGVNALVKWAGVAALKDTPRVLDDDADEMDRPHEGRSRASIRAAA